jgi:protein-S-isoprenylcysteine O-methyltransferase Ste14
MTQANATHPSSAIPAQTGATIPHMGVRVALRFTIMTPLVVAIFFLPARTVRWWQGWLFLAVYIGFALAAFFFFLKTAPELVRRRLESREPLREQRRIIGFGALLLTAIFTLPGFDHRLGWSRAWLGAVPTWLELLSLAIVLACEFGMGWVLWTNHFAARTIRVEDGQKVITTGPYRVVRHPLYSFSLVMLLFIPLAVGSYVTVPALLFFVPIYVFRILNEEKVLRAELPGYTDYCEQTRWRLLPGLW